MEKPVGYIYDPFMSSHEHPFDNHLECGDRIHRIYQELLKRGYISKMQPIRSRLALKEELLLGHTEVFIDKVGNDLSLGSNKQINDALKNARYYNGDLYGNKYTLECALLSAGSIINLVSAILQETIDRGVAIVRPPSHHTCGDSAGGFCFFNGVAISAIKANNSGKRVAIIDLDLHYGDGTVDIIKNHKDIQYYSIHRYDNGTFYPGTGKVSTYSNIHNYPLNYSSGTDEIYISIFNKHIIPSLQNLQPDLILVSAGFDCLKKDPLGGYNVTPEGYGVMIKLLLGIQSKIAIVLEGGYNLDEISKGMAECVKSLLFLN